MSRDPDWTPPHGTPRPTLPASPYDRRFVRSPSDPRATRTPLTATEQAIRTVRNYLKGKL